MIWRLQNDIRQIGTETRNANANNNVNLNLVTRKQQPEAGITTI